MSYVSIPDLVERWVYTRAGVHKAVRRRGFPAPAFLVSRGRVAVWEESQIELYERMHPELLDDVAKQQKQRGYHYARLKGRAVPSAGDNIEL